ncbi:hypothetical protein OPIT5_04670 [Opitutaceae bacterium TAV5]|nr:hypothetical protein OPIT5_04670 [Opitutaceae bacterium TAV5]
MLPLRLDNDDIHDCLRAQQRVFKALLGTITEACDDVYSALLRLQRQRQELSADKPVVVTARKKTRARPVAGEATTVRKSSGTKSRAKIVPAKSAPARKGRKKETPQPELPLRGRTVHRKNAR